MIRRYIQLAQFFHHAPRGQAALVTQKLREPCMKALSLRLFGRVTLETAVTCVTCSFSSQWWRPKKERKNRGHPGNNSMHTVWKHLNTIAPISFQAVQPLYPSRFHTPASNIPLADFQCPSCTNILNRPIQLTLCRKMICMDCFVAHMKGGSGVCPSCSSHHEHGIDNVQSPP